MASTGITPTEAAAFRRGTVDGRKLTPQEREQMMKSHLPDEPLAPSSLSQSQSKSQPQRTSTYNRPLPKANHGPLKTTIHFLLYHTIAFFFSVFFRFRRAWRLAYGKMVAVMKYHHRTPEFIQKDVKRLRRLPSHLSVILDYHESDEYHGNAGLEGLLNDVAEIAAWTASAGIPYLSVYEPTGVLKDHLKHTHRTVSKHLEVYFGAQRKPTISLRAPHELTYSPPSTPRASTDSADERQHLTILLLSELDGRNTMVDLTRTFADLVQEGRVELDQIDSRLIQSELTIHVCSEPDLLVLFSPTVVLKGYPPWQLRLTEIIHIPDNKGVNYQVFLRALRKYAKAEMRVGR
ncbi:di-trans,poly-cis-decaprenylcistransferas-like protein [Massariosphaeria phaeospora]|uniref:ditrans,polycis-polyprenyl diphosphate synthase [(2E,6E)-farnesyldiphosphate specific] n=1 Tax=Massariosphaeria phaeospora TaxID=100035 RepID=A0A7C8IAP8_9PLEO|nr:di-trans,poly-cis-decaprenylcistransferas-like protein [Massariosphaeria phaeospora]